MRVIEKKLDKVLIELTSEEISRLGFDKIWDDIRLVYPQKKYEIENVEENHNGKIIIITLINIDFETSILRLNKKMSNDEDGN
jgi:cellobiose-specific phosphotransferase system component IIB